jgi:ribonuclease BN (tRNA processing enzyme)
VELIVLGANGTWPEEGGALSGYLLRQDGFNLWVDCGSGTMANLQKYIGIGDVDAMIITHEHADHCVDVYPLFYARYYARQGEDHMPLYIPKGFGGRLNSLLSEESIAAFREGFDVREVEPGDEFEIGPFRVRARGMSHLGLPALGFRIENDGTSLAYTGDTGPTPELVELARGAAVLLAEATYQDGDELTAFHMSSRQAAEHARDAGVGRLVLTHILPTHDRGESIRQAAAVYDGPIDAAVEGFTLEVDE